MKKTAKLLLSSVLAIVLCASLVGGATFALFTSESTTDIAITSGKVAVSASVDSESLALYSYESDGSDYVSTPQEGSRFAMGGTAAFSDDGTSLTLDKIVPGDKAEFTLNIVNTSNVNVKYKYTVTVGGDQALFDALRVSLGDEEFVTVAFDPSTRTTAWREWTVGSESQLTVAISIELPYDFDDDGGEGTIQDSSCTLSFTVSAVQGNAKTVDAQIDAPTVASAKELTGFAQSVNSGNDYAGRTITLAGDIDLSDVAWQSIGSEAAPFKGTFDGNGFTISNITISTAGASYSGLFGYISHGTVENLTLKTVKLSASATQVGALAGHIDSSTVRGVTVDGFDGSSASHNSGGLVGEAFTGTIADCKVINSTLGRSTARRAIRVGGIAGWGYANISGCTVADCIIAGSFKVGGVIGQYDEGAREMKNIVVRNTVFYIPETTLLSANSFGCVVGFSNYTYENGTKLFENITVDNCTVDSQFSAARYCLSVGGIVGLVSTDNGATCTLSFKNVHVNDLSLVSDGDVKHFGGIVGSRYTNSGGSGTFVFNMEDCSVSIKQIVTGRVHTSHTDVLYSGAFVGGFPVKIDLEMPGVPLIESPASLQFNFVGDNSFVNNSGVELGALYTDDSTFYAEYTVNGELPQER